MNSFDTSRPAAGLSAGFISDYFTRASGAFAEWNDARITRNALYKLSSRELEDIGLTRGDVDDITSRSKR